MQFTAKLEYLLTGINQLELYLLYTVILSKLARETHLNKICGAPFSYDCIVQCLCHRLCWLRIEGE